MASILPVGSRWRTQVRQRGQSIAKTLKTKGAAEPWAREKEVEIDKGRAEPDGDRLRSTLKRSLPFRLTGVR